MKKEEEPKIVSGLTLSKTLSEAAKAEPASLINWQQQQNPDIDA